MSKTASEAREHARHVRVWRLLHALLQRWIHRKFNLCCENLQQVDGSLLLIPNHSCAWDPLLVAMSLKDK